MKEPNGADILRTLINLYAKREGVVVKYEIVHRSKDESNNIDERL